MHLWGGSHDLKTPLETQKLLLEHRRKADLSQSCMETFMWDTASENYMLALGSYCENLPFWHLITSLLHVWESKTCTQAMLYKFCLGIIHRHLCVYEYTSLHTHTWSHCIPESNVRAGLPSQQTSSLTHFPQDLCEFCIITFLRMYFANVPDNSRSTALSWLHSYSHQCPCYDSFDANSVY